MTFNLLNKRMLMATCAAVAVTAANGAYAAEKSFNIPAQSLPSALQAFGAQSGVAVAFRADMVRPAVSASAVGAYEPSAALGALLRGTAFDFVRVGEGFTIVPGKQQPAAQLIRVANDQPAETSSGRASNIAPPTAAEVEQIVVTGSLIRGVAPVGTNVVSVSAADIQRTGAISGNQILSSIPSVTNAFNTVANTPTSAARSTFRPRIRSLPDNNSNTTLVLVDGHNMVGVGANFTTPDAGMIPPGAIERVEVVPDGSSSIYGSDAVAGIINFITRTKFEGFQVDATAGIAKGYRADSLGLTGGTAWNGGSAVLSIFGRQQDELSNADRARPRNDLRSFGGSDFRPRTCAPGTITAGGISYALPDRLPNTFNLCETGPLGITTPKETQYSAYAAVTQAITPDVDFELKAMGGERITKNRGAQRGNTAALITNANPFFRPIGNETQHTVAFSYAPGLGTYVYSTGDYIMFQVTPSVTWRLGNNWRAKALVDYGKSDTQIHAPQLNAVAEVAALRGPGLTLATALNPYDVAQTNQSVLNAIGNYENYARNTQSLMTYRATVDGPLYTLPGGAARVALGVQHMTTGVDVINGNNPVGITTGAARAKQKRSVDSIYGELLVPIIGPDNSLPGVRSFDIDLSARYDKYDDVGGTKNPKIGATWEVFEGVKLRSNWGKAFVAPSLSDTTGATDGRWDIQATNTIRTTDSALDRNRPTVLLNNGNEKLKPQTADSWSYGFDINPKPIPGLTLSATYWAFNLRDIIQSGSSFNTQQALALPTLPDYYILRPTLAQLLQYDKHPKTGAPLPVIGALSLASLYGIGNDPYLMIDRSRHNVATIKMRGIDFRAAYRMPTEWGAVYGSVTGTKYLRRDNSPAPGTVINDLASDRTRLQVQSVAGVDIGKFTGTATFNYTQGYPVSGVVGQTKVDAFLSTNLFLRYELNEDLNVSVNVDNAFDKVLPFVNLNNGVPNSGGFPSVSTLGRYFNFAVRKRF